MDFLIIALISYTLGSIPFGLILTKLFLKKDIRDIGSGNIGATNVLRTGNKLVGYSTLTLDVLKAVIPILYVEQNYPSSTLIASLCVFIGHVFPLWLKFKGGKGVAVYVGILFSLDLIYGFLFIGIWLLIFLISKYSSLSSIIASTAIPIYILISESDSLMFFCIMFVLILFTHRDNVKRLKNKEESKTKIY